MDLRVHIQEAFVNLISAKLRSLLAILGILVGTGSVVALISSSQMATDNALRQFKALGTNLLSMDIQSEGGGANSQLLPLSLSQLPAIKNAAPQIHLIAPYTEVYEGLYFNGKSLNGSAVGATETLMPVVKLSLAKGRFVSYLDGSARYCVIGHDLYETIKKYGVQNPVGKQVRVGQRLYTVIGVLKKWKTNMFMFTDLNQAVIIPLQASLMLSKYAQINNLLFRLVKNPNLALAQKNIKMQMERLLPKRQFDFRSPKQVLKIMTKQRSTFTWLLAMIGGISLLVGGIGVMNIMLVSVVERKKEIGIRMAVGAKAKDIRQMFLIESIALTVFGGLLGVSLGVATSFGIAYFANWQFELYWVPPVLGFLVSVLVGIVSGFYPAYSASKMDPIECLEL